MASDATPAYDDRVLLLAPTSRDASITRALLERAGIALEVCTSFDSALHELARGAAVLILPEERVSVEENERLARILRDQPPWSDLPVLVLAQAGADSAASNEAVRTLGNVTLLERPLRVTTLLSAVRSAVRARQRQYQIREHLAVRARNEEALRVADQRKDEFLATLGHELRNPLAPLQSGLHLLRLPATPEVDRRQIMTVMERQIDHLGRLVDDLLGVSRITRGLVEVRHDPLDLIQIVRAALDTSWPQLQAARHEVTVDLAPGPITVAGDAVRLTQVFANLLTNAAKYTNPGGQIRVTARRDGATAVVSVRDNGIGIAPALLTSVFDMFMQVDRSSRRAQGGLGIGLTLVRSLVAMHGGRVEARSDGPGTGSEFVVELPVVSDSVAVMTPSPRIRRLPARRILIVDDNRDAADTLGALLEALGATVAIEHSGQAALERLDGFAPDAMLLDIGMPDLDGYEVARQIRARPGHASTTLIALTGWGQHQDQAQSRAAGFDHHMVKPVDIEQLRAVLTSPIAAHGILARP